PTIVFKATANYPRVARRRGIEGYVLLEFTVNEDGSTTAPKVIEAVPNGIFDKAAIRAVKRYRYQPGQKNNKPISVAGIRSKITFKLR
ncbi:MAG: energy transducer TonB, partial [Kangiellaceae bacterium]|nr:energy transducer TonB [Kangiellaceae bacterium]